MVSAAVRNRASGQGNGTHDHTHIAFSARRPRGCSGRRPGRWSPGQRARATPREVHVHTGFDQLGALTTCSGTPAIPSRSRISAMTCARCAPHMAALRWRVPVARQQLHNSIASARVLRMASAWLLQQALGQGGQLGDGCRSGRPVDLGAAQGAEQRAGSTMKCGSGSPRRA